ncbi:MAG: short-chain dehydrogenase/reductase [Acidobacteria bacterium]|nr:MAG: short-chain dehydrogenase/reductase [Acidobacteriota bacterium]
MADSNVVLVTGASTGFGRLISVTLARRGYTVFASMRDLTGRNRSRAAELEELGRNESLRLRALEVDVTSDTSVQQAVEQVVREAGRIDAVVNNAGVAYWGLLETFTVEQAKQIFETNFFGPLRVNRAVLPHMRQRRSGLLIHISSIAGRLVLPSMALYCATKFALEAMAETLRYEVSQLGIDSLIVEPGEYPTAIFGNAAEAADQARAVDYGAVAEMPRKILEGLASNNNDVQQVADRVVELIEMPAGSRPVRSLVGTFAQQCQPLNDLALQFQTGALQAFGLSDLMALRRAERQVA